MTTNNDLVSDLRWVPTIALLGAAGLLFGVFWFDPLSVEDVTRWWSLPSGVNWATFATALGSLIGVVAVTVARRGQPLPLGVLLFTLVSATMGAILVAVDWILTKIAPGHLNVEGSHALFLAMLAGDAAAAFWLTRIGRAQQRRSRAQLLSMGAE
jgi:hypothetical protein